MRLPHSMTAGPHPEILAKVRMVEPPTAPRRSPRSSVPAATRRDLSLKRGVPQRLSAQLAKAGVEPSKRARCRPWCRVVRSLAPDDVPEESGRKRNLQLSHPR